MNLFKNTVIVLIVFLNIFLFSSCEINIETPKKYEKIGVLSDFNLSQNNEIAKTSFTNILKAYNKSGVKTLFFGGNMISGEKSDYDILKNTIDSIYKTEKPEIIYAMGQSEWLIKSDMTENDAKDIFLNFTERQDNNYFFKKDSYSIICISGEDITCNISENLNSELVNFLMQCETNKPIYVVCNTDNFEETTVYNTLSKYSNVVIFNGKSNSCVYNSRNIIQKDFTTIYTGIVDSGDIKQETQAFYSGKDLIYVNDYVKQYSGLIITVKENSTEVERIKGNGQKLTEIWNISAEKESFIYTDKNYLTDIKNDNIIKGSLNFNYIQNINDGVTLKVVFNCSVKTVSDCYKLTLSGGNFKKEIYIINLNYSLNFSFDKEFNNLPYNDYEVSLSAIDFFGNESGSYLHNNIINSEIIISDQEKTLSEETDLIHKLHSSNGILATISNEKTSVNSETSLKISGETFENNYPYLILKTDNFFDCTNKTIKIDGCFGNAASHLSIVFVFSEDESFSLKMNFYKSESFTTSSINLRDFSDYNHFDMSKVLEIKIILCLDTDNENVTEGNATVYLDNIIIE